MMAGAHSYERSLGQPTLTQPAPTQPTLTQVAGMLVAGMLVAFMLVALIVQHSPNPYTYTHAPMDRRAWAAQCMAYWGEVYMGMGVTRMGVMKVVAAVLGLVVYLVVVVLVVARASLLRIQRNISSLICRDPVSE